MGARKPKEVGIGVQFYKDLIDENQVYVDKTSCLMGLLDRAYKATVITRPRRFGKSLMLSMIQTYLEYELDGEGNQVAKERYFEGTRIYESGEMYREHMGNYPVIHLDFGALQYDNLNQFAAQFSSLLVFELDRLEHMYHLGLLGEDYCSTPLMRPTKVLSLEDMQVMLLHVCRLLERKLGKKVIILVDEYDAPIRAAFFKNYYDDMVSFMRGFMINTFKSNSYLKMGVLTGAMRVGKESFFTGFNNARVVTLLDPLYATEFGFTEQEVRYLLALFGLEEHLETVKEWYDGYRFDKVDLYNPWSVLNYLSDLIEDPTWRPDTYWVNTSANLEIRELIRRLDSDQREELEVLITGGTIEKVIHKHLTFRDFQSQQDQVWAFLLFSGYLKVIDRRNGADLDEGDVYTLKVPNLEVQKLYRREIKEVFKGRVRSRPMEELQVFYDALLVGDSVAVQGFLNQELVRLISYHDNQESFYHAFLLGLLSRLGAEVFSNREARKGRPDIYVRLFNATVAGFIIEVKRAQTGEELPQLAFQALQQVRERRYHDAFIGASGEVLAYGLAFWKKACVVSMERLVLPVH